MSSIHRFRLLNQKVPGRACPDPGPSYAMDVTVQMSISHWVTAQSLRIVREPYPYMPG